MPSLLAVAVVVVVVVAVAVAVAVAVVVVVAVVGRSSGGNDSSLIVAIPVMAPITAT